MQLGVRIASATSCSAPWVGSPTLLTAGTRGAWWAVTRPGDVVAGGAGRAQAALGTGLSKPAMRAGCRKSGLGVVGGSGASAARRDHCANTPSTLAAGPVGAGGAEGLTVLTP